MYWSLGPKLEHENLGYQIFHYSPLNYLLFCWFGSCTIPNIILVSLIESHDNIEMHLSFFDELFYLSPLILYFDFNPFILFVLRLHMIVNLVYGLYDSFQLGIHPPHVNIISLRRINAWLILWFLIHLQSRIFGKWCM